MGVPSSLCAEAQDEASPSEDSMAVFADRQVVDLGVLHVGLEGSAGGLPLNLERMMSLVQHGFEPPA